MTRRKRIYRLWAIRDPDGVPVWETIAETKTMAAIHASNKYAQIKRLRRGIVYRAVKLRVEVLDD